MKKTSNLFILILLSISAFALFSCDTQNPDGIPSSLTFSDETATIIKNGIQCNNESSTHEIPFSSPVAWSAKSDVAWATITPNNGVAGSANIVVQVEKNVSIDDRATIITITAGKEQKTFTITQEGNSSADPEGTVSVNLSSSSDILGIEIKNGSFSGNANSQPIKFVSLGQIKGLGNVSHIPKSGWANQTAVTEGNGYIAYLGSSYIRMFVVSSSADAALIKYQTPFLGSETAITVEATEVNFSASDVLTKTIALSNSYLYPFSVRSDTGWCQVSAVSQTSNVPSNAINIIVDEFPEPESRTANVVVSSPGRKDITIKITQAGEIWISKEIKIKYFTVADRNIGAQQDGIAYNYTNDTSHPDHKNSAFKGSYHTWIEAQSICPSGWRPPLKAEMEMIIDAMQFFDGRVYIKDTEGNRCFFPLSGRLDSTSDVRAHYWSASKKDLDNAWYLNITHPNNSSMMEHLQSNGFSVRCIKVDQ